MRPTSVRLLRLRLLSQTEVTPSSLRLPPSNRHSPSNLTKKSSENESSIAEKLVEAKTQGDSQSWPSNLRIEKAEKKTLFWKVARPQRMQLKKLLREDLNQ